MPKVWLVFSTREVGVYICFPHGNPSPNLPDLVLSPYFLLTHTRMCLSEITHNTLGTMYFWYKMYTERGKCSEQKFNYSFTHSFVHSITENSDKLGAMVDTKRLVSFVFFFPFLRKGSVHIAVEQPIMYPSQVPHEPSCFTSYYFIADIYDPLP